MTGSRGPRWFRGRAAVLLGTMLAATVLLLWGADRLARTAAESVLADKLQQATGVLATPEVEVRGGPFLLQAVRGRYEQVDITLTDLSGGALHIDRLDAELTGVRLPFADLLLRTPDVLVVERSEERALLGYGDLDEYLAFTGRPYRVQAAGAPEEVRIDAPVQVFGRPYEVTVDARLGAEDGALTITPTRLDTGSDLDRAAELLLGERFTFRVPLDPLPFGQEITAIDARPYGVVVRAEGEAIVLNL